ncbi:MAG: indole-3-glycerol phosphate synthase TrpC [Muribaculaceae bacterium]|nr:indole-3-glycerol phosphate synthase TrpC [Muribaculaceae bacterium]
MADNILQRIAATKRREVEAMKDVIPEAMMRRLAEDCKRETLDMSGRIRLSPVGIIAEHKRRSPSKGEISPMSDVASVARAYASNRAAAMSVLTDTPYFGGSLEDLAVARKAAPTLPLLRKEFIVDDYQIYQARAYGADAVLLIASMISGEEIRRLNDLAHSLGMQTLVELHTLEEMKSLPSDADMVGVNNRDLTSFNTDLRNAFHMASSLPENMLKVAESGIKTPQDLCRLREAGFNGFLIGEAFMSTPDPGETLREFIAGGNS